LSVQALGQRALLHWICLFSGPTHEILFELRAAGCLRNPDWR
jgi:hypothetical protein